MWFGKGIALKKFNLKALFLSSRVKGSRTWIVGILTCCIVFQFEASSSDIRIRMKMKEEMVTWRDSAGWHGITTIWISQHGWCIWITIINSQWIPAENVNFYFCSFYNEKTLKLTSHAKYGRDWKLYFPPLSSFEIVIFKPFLEFGNLSHFFSVVKPFPQF